MRPAVECGRRPAFCLAVLLALAPIVAEDPLAGQAPTRADRRLLESIDLYTGVAGRVDDTRARELLLAAAENSSDVLATMWIARVHSRGRMGFARDEARARAIADEVISGVRDLAEGGDAEALFLMGTAHDEGLGTAVDAPEAYRWYRRAADTGHVLAAHNVGNMYREGRGVAADPVAAAAWWLRAALKGDAITQLRLGEAYEGGNGVDQDLATARLWYGRAAASGNAAARDALARLTG